MAYKLFSGDQYSDGEQYKISAGEEIKEIDFIDEKDVAEFVDDVKEEIDDITNLFAQITIKFIELKRLPFDAIQSCLDMIQTVNYGGSKWFLPWNITFKKDEILNDPNKNQYVNYTEGDTNLGSDGQKKIFLDEDEYGIDTSFLGSIFFKQEVEIPIIPVDIYSMAKGKIDIFDVNFLNGQNDTVVHSGKSPWLVLRNLVSILMKATIYIGSAALIGALIIHGISIVTSIYIKKEEETPEKRKEHIDGIHNFIKSLMLLIGSVIIMGLCIYISNAFFDDMKVTDTMELPIRVNVGERK